MATGYSEPLEIVQRRLIDTARELLARDRAAALVLPLDGPHSATFVGVGCPKDLVDLLRPGGMVAPLAPVGNG